jgi:putative cell wall-binding protein
LITTKRSVKRAAAGATAGLLALTGIGAAAAPAYAVPGFSFDRLAGNDRYGTAADIAVDSFGTSDNVLLANGVRFPDALSGNYLAGALGAPILLTDQNTLPQATRDAFTRLGAKTVTILGGTAAVSAAVEAELRTMGLTINRVAGVDRYETSRAVAEEPGNENVGTVGTSGRTAILASGQNFADALAAGPLAYAADLPVILTEPGELSDAARQALENLNIDHVLIAGGTAAVSAAVETEVRTLNEGTTTQRLQGNTRRETAVEIANFAVANLGFVETHVNLARGDDFADALAGGPHGGVDRAPILLTAGPTALGNAARDYLVANSDTLEDGHIFGGTAAVSAAVEAEATEAAQGEAQPQPTEATVTSSSVEAGQPITGTITGENIDTVTVAADCVQDGTVTDTDTATEDVEFSLPTNNDFEGSCTLAFTVSFTDDRADETVTTTVNVTQPPSATVRPELVGAEILSTTTSTQATPTNPAGTTVRYTFDEAVIGGTAAPRAENFHIYNTAGDQVDNGAQTVVSNEGNVVVIRFGNVTTTEGAGVLTLATVDTNAVTDQQGDVNPEGDAAIGASSGGDTTLAAGITDAPDLLSVGGFRQGATAGTTAVDFTFDEAAFTTSTGGFHLILVNNPNNTTGAGDNDILCVAPASTDTTTSGGGTVPGGNGTTTITVICTNPTDPNTGTASTTPIAASDVARGTVDEGAVNDRDPDAPNTNVLQAADVSNNGNTFEPDLVSVQFLPGETSTDVDRAVFTFDAEVTDATAPENFAVYDDQANVFLGTTAVVNTQNRQQVLVTFEEPGVTPTTESTTAVDRAVGGFVRDAAVTTAETATTRALTNEQDEVGVANTVAGTTQTSGRTDDPDLTSVSLAQSEATTDEFGNPTPGTFQARYTFDEAVARTTVGDNVNAPATTGDFFLYLADGTRLVATNCTVGTTTTGADRNDNTVTCTTFDVADGTGTDATSEQVGSATLGTVDDGAVASADADGGTNPEGAEFTTGGTGTRTR